MMNPRRELSGLLITSHSCTSWPFQLRHGFQQPTLPPEVGWDNEIDSDFKKLSVGPVKGGRPSIFLEETKVSNISLALFVLFIEQLDPVRPYGKICDSALDLIGFTPQLGCERDAVAHGEL